MSEAYFNLKQKLEELGYCYSLPIDAIPLVECVVADLLQTTRSLQHFMDLSKEALTQRDSLLMEAEPYKCDNAKLIQENNILHQDVIKLKEENIRLGKETKRKMKTMTDEIIKKDTLINKLQHDVRDLSLRGLCIGTQSSRNKSKRRDDESGVVSKICICDSKKDVNFDKNTEELTKNLHLLKEKNAVLYDEMTLLKTQLENRDSEIIRLNMLLEGGRPLVALKKDYTNVPECTDQVMIHQLQEIQKENESLKKEIDLGLEKQHEAMSRALNLAEKNRSLNEELQKLDKLALQVEEDCNRQIASYRNENKFLQKRLESLAMKNTELERELSVYKAKDLSAQSYCTQDSLNMALKEKEILQNEVRDLLDINKNFQDKIVSLSQLNKSNYERISTDCQYNNAHKCLQKEELQNLLLEERIKYEKYLKDIEEKLSETLNIFNRHIPKQSEKSFKYNTPVDNAFVKELHNRLCESEQKILMLRKENDELKNDVAQQGDCNRENFKDIVKQLNLENSQLTKENIYLSEQISLFKNVNSTQHNKDIYNSKEISKLEEKNNLLSCELESLKKDQQEYKLKYRETVDLVEKLKRDLAFQQKEVEQLQEENCSFRMTNRTGKASVEQLREECNFLREQIKMMQTDVIKEKTLASQIKNIQIETERNSSELQNELLSMQKKFSLSRDNISTLEKNCKRLQSEINTLKNDKISLIDNIKLLDQERDKLVIELDNKTELVSNLEHKINMQAYEISNLEKENLVLKKNNDMQKTMHHKLSDNESQIMFLNGEILRLQQQYDTAIMENKHLQNSLADANGTLKLTKLELDKSKKEVDCLKQQLQHYVAEVRRIEELLSQKEAERSDMLEQFASLSVEANILENTNHSLESESASKSLKLQTYVSKIQNLESKLIDKDNIIDSQSAHIAAMTCKVTTLENEIKLISDEKKILEQNVSYLKHMCNNLQVEKTHKALDLKDTDSELKLYENKIKSLSNNKAMLQNENVELTNKLSTTEILLSNARREIVELKLALQDATSETKSLQDCVSRLSRREAEIHEHTMANEDIHLPLTLEETIREVENEDDVDCLLLDDSTLHRTYSKYSHGSTI